MFGTFRVKALMTRDPVTLRSDAELQLAEDVMKMNRIRHLPVLAPEGDAVVGVVSQRDLFRGALEQCLETQHRGGESVLGALRVEDVMSEAVVSVDPELPITDAANLMTEQKIGCLPVVENGRLVGILTEADFVALMGSEKRRSQARSEL